MNVVDVVSRRWRRAVFSSLFVRRFAGVDSLSNRRQRDRYKIHRVIIRIFWSRLQYSFFFCAPLLFFRRLSGDYAERSRRRAETETPAVPPIQLVGSDCTSETKKAQKHRNRLDIKTARRSEEKKDGAFNRVRRPLWRHTLTNGGAGERTADAATADAETNVRRGDAGDGGTGHER